MPNISENLRTWEENYDWSLLGEEWSVRWGGSEAQWFGSILPRIHRLIPCNNILEIATGFGRWTKFLIPNTITYSGIDICEKCIDWCRNNYEASDRIKFYVNNGISLDMIADNTFDFIFSFDSLVHVDLSVFESYIPQIISKLSQKGFAFIHHSNLADNTIDISKVEFKHNRSRDVSAKNIADLILNNNGSIVIQEFLNWHDHNSPPIDCITVFCKKNININSVSIKNNNFSIERDIIRNNQSFYSNIN